MDFKISSVKIECNKETFLVPLANGITFFYGNTGVGKSTLLNLINYVLGQDLIHTQVIDDEIKQVSLDAFICGKRLIISRKIFSNLITVNEENITRVFSTKKNYGNRNTFSNYLYDLAGIKPLEMLRNRSSQNINVTFANFMWYSYLRQDELDNTFFYLCDNDGNFKQYASNYVLRAILDESKALKKEVQQEINQINEKQKIVQEKISILREIFSVSSVFKIDIGSEIAKKYQKIELAKQSITSLMQLDEINNNHLVNLIAQSKTLGKNEAEVRYLHELSKLQDVRREYEKLLKEYEIEKQKCIEQLNYMSDEPFENNILLLQDVFKECLLNINFPGFTEKDIIKINPTNFTPSVYSNVGKFCFNYSALSSGGIRTIFKICFVLSIHMLVKKLNLKNMLPTFLMIDTPMKNISERVDKHIYFKLYNFIYNLFGNNGELCDSQLIIVDKEIPDIFKNGNILCKMYTKESPLIPL